MKATLYGLTKNKNDIHVKSQLEKMLAQVSSEGAAVIDGANIAAETIYGKSIVAGSIEATQIKAGAITSDHITANGIVADKIKTGVLRSTNGASWLNLNDGTFSYANGNFTFQDGKMVIRAHTIELGGEEVPTKTQTEEYADNLGETLQGQIDTSIKSTEVEYYSSASSTSPVGGSWSTTAPAWQEGRFVWSRTKITPNKGSVIYKPNQTGTNISGATGNSAKIVTVTPSAQLFWRNQENAVTPATITVDGSVQNTTISAWQYSVNGGSFTTTLPTGVTRSGNKVSLTGAAVTARTIAVKALDSSGNTDTTTIAMVQDGVKGVDGSSGPKGENAIVGILTNESITVPASESGAVTSFAGATGTFEIYDGITRKTGSGVTYSVSGTPSGITVSINATTGIYTISAMTGGTSVLSGNATLQAVYNGVTIQKVITVTKAMTGKTGATGSTGTKGSDAKIVTLTSSAQIFAKNADGVVSPTNITVEGVSQNTSIATWEYSVNGGTFSSTLPTGLSRTGNVVSITGSSVTAKSISLRAKDASGVSDVLSIAVVQDGEKGLDGSKGADAYTVVLSNEAHTFVGNTASAIASSVTVNVVAYKGATRVGATIGTISGAVEGMNTSIATNGTTTASFTVSVTTAMSTTNGLLTIPITVDGKVFSKTFSFALALKGADGANGSAGANAKVIIVNPSAQIFTKDANGNVTPSTIRVDGTAQNVTISTWEYSIEGETFSTSLPAGLTRSGNKVTITGSSMTAKNISVRASGGGVSDTTTIAMVQDGAKGSTGGTGAKGDNSIVGYLTNESVTLGASSTGVVSSFATASGTFRVFDGITEVTTNAACVFSLNSSTGVTLTINSAGVYTVTAMSTDTATAEFKAVYKGITITKALSLSKSRVGETGSQGPKGATGSQGPKGDIGTSVESVTEYYLATSASSGVTTSTSGWTTTIQTMTATNKYLWNYEKINFSDDTNQPTIPVIIGVYGDKGQTGATGSTGATGRSITSITEHYLSTSANSGVTRSTSGWSTTMKTTTETNKYLWNYETINWSSGTTPTYVEPIIIGVHGAKGATGPQGVSPIVGLLTNESITLPASDLGVVPSFTGATGTFNVYEGTVLRNASATYSVVSQSGITVSITQSGVYTVSAMTTGTSVLSGTATLRAVYGGVTIDKILAVTKALAGTQGATGSTGATGATGSAGQNATRYWINASTDAIKKDVAGTIVPSTITFSGFSKTGTANPVAYAGRFIVQTSTDGTSYTTAYTSSANQASYTYTIPTTASFVKARYYLAGGTSVLLDEQTVPVLVDAEGIDKKYEGQSLLDKTEILSGTEIFTDKADDNSVVHVEIDGKSYQHVDESNLFDIQGWLSTPDSEKPASNGVPCIDIELKPNTKYTVSTNIPDRGSLYDVFSMASNSSASSGTNGVSINITRTTQTLSDGILRIAVRDYSLDKNSDYWIKVEEGTIATPFVGYSAPTPDYPIAIHSLNDFDVVSQTNKYVNIAKNRIETIFGSGSEWVQHQNSKVLENNPVEIKGMDNWNLRRIKADIDNMIYLDGGENNGEGVRGDNYTLAVYVKNIGSTDMYFGYNGLDSITTRKINLESRSVSSSSTVSSGEEVLMLVDFTHRISYNFWQYSIRSNSSQIEIIMSDVMIFEGRVGQDIVNDGGLFGSPLNPEDITSEEVWTGIDKTNISLSEPLRSIGDVKDRLFRDNDGLWNIERNVGKVVFNGTESWRMDTGSQYGDGQRFQTTINDSLSVQTRNTILSSHFSQQSNELTDKAFQHGSRIFIYPKATVATSLSTLKSWLASNNVTFLYQLETQTIENLPDGLQQKLNNIESFKDSNYVYAIVDKTNILPEYVRDNLHPNMKATFKGGGWYARFKTEQGFNQTNKSVDSLKNETIPALKDGLLNSSEKEAVKQSLNVVSADKKGIDTQFTTVYANTALTGTAKTNLNSAKVALNTAFTNLQSAINAVLGVVDGTRITTAQMTLVTARLNEYGTALSIYNQRYEQAQDAISSAKEKASKDYALAQANLAETESKAYADGKITAEEERAIQDAKDKLAEAKKYVDDMEVGGRNLFENTKSMSDMPFLYTEKYGEFSTVSSKPTSGYVDTYTKRTPILEGLEHTVSFYARADANIDISCFFYNPNTTTNVVSSTGQSSSAADGRCTVSVTTEWKRYWITWKQSKDGDAKLVIIGRNSSTNRLLIAGVKFEKGTKATDWTPAPEDVELEQNKKIYNPVRYIRDWIKGSSANTSNHWFEIMANDTNGTNVAQGKTVTTNGTASNLSVITNGLVGGTYSSTGTGKQYVEVDLGSVYYNIASVSIWHYHIDNRTYYETRTEVSEDRINWYPVFDSLTEGTYVETESGNTYPNTRARSESLISAYNMSQQLATSTSNVVINGGNITAGTVKSANSDSWINLDNGQFSFGKGNMVWNGSNLTVKGNIDASSINTGTLAAGRIPNLSADKITVGILKDKNNRNNINLDTGTFSLANGNIVYNGSTLSITGGVSFSALDSTTQANITSGAAAKSTLDSKSSTWDTVTGKATPAQAQGYANTAETNAKNYTKDYVGKIFRAYGIGYSRRNDAEVPFYDGRIMDESGNRLTTGNDRSYLLVVIDRNDTVVHAHTYDIYGSVDVESKALVAKLNSYDKSYLIILVGSHAPANGRTSNGLPDVIYKFGGSKEVFIDENWSSGHPVYLLVGRNGIGEGNGYEVFSSHADGSMIDVLIPVKNGATTLIGSDSTLRKIASSAKDIASNAKGKTDAWTYPSTTEINGSSIKTGSLSAGKITTGEMHGDRITAGTLKADRLIAGSLTIENLNSDTQSKINNGHSAKATLDSKASLWDAKLTDAQVAAKILADKKIIDTRATNQNPAWYFSNYPNQIVREFKNVSTMTVGTGTYGILTTDVPWGSNSGGSVKQTFRTNTEEFKRDGTSTSWSNWVNHDAMASDAQNRVGQVESNINNAVTTIDGTGITVKDGSFYLQDDVSDEKYTIATKENYISHHSFENFFPASGQLGGDDERHLVYKLKSDNLTVETNSREPQYKIVDGTDYKWEGFGSPSMVHHSHDYATGKKYSIFGDKAIKVTNSSYVAYRTWGMIITPNSQFTVSAHFKKRATDSSTTGALKIVISRVTSSGTLTQTTIATKTASKVGSDNPQRISCTFTVPSSFNYLNEHLKIEFMSSTTGPIVIDGIQMVDGPYPSIYLPTSEADTIRSGKEKLSIPNGGEAYFERLTVDGNVTFNNNIGTYGDRFTFANNSKLYWNNSSGIGWRIFYLGSDNRVHINPDRSAEDVVVGGNLHPRGNEYFGHKGATWHQGWFKGHVSTPSTTTPGAGAAINIYASNNIFEMGVGSTTNDRNGFIQVRHSETAYPSAYGTLKLQALGGTVTTGGNFTVSGSKNAVHPTRDGFRLTPAYETAESYLGDIGEDKTAHTSEVKVWIETLFFDVINTDVPYQVFLQSYGEGHVWVSERNKEYFIVKSSLPNTPFAYEIKGKRRGYESDRLALSEITYKDSQTMEGLHGGNSTYVEPEKEEEEE